ncbi:hypothetical protein [Microcoleus sp. FACHB-672]|uniref:hypothetical protein n=1 Tax=Microcoleus sp. FACHB-672 TaxID=2692825 RepID=UPI001685E9F4|nr:hypothetical protein [Microcoleus sp. FACHB-672]MBD2041679.1 hypothetical protein [Microcoleus sp. FACHB-672]
MTDTASIELTIDFQNSGTSSTQQEKLTQTIWKQMRDIPGVKVDRVSDPNPPEESKGAAFLWGLLQAKVSLSSLKNVFGFLGDRLGDKPIKIKAKFADGREFEVEARSQLELQAAEEAIQRFSQLE